MLKPLSLIAAGSLAATASAQIGSTPSSGGLAGLLGGAVPNIGSVGVGNAAGLVGYCLKNNLLGGAATAPVADPAPGAAPTPVPATGAQAILERLTGRQSVQSSPGYAAGQAGQVEAGGRTLSLDGVRGQLKGKLCKLALNRARSFL